MKKALSALTTLAALTVTAVAVGQEATGGGPAPTSNGPMPTALPGASPPPPASVPVLPIAPDASGDVEQSPSQTTLTAADEPVAASRALVTAPPRDTITVRQTYRPNRPLLYTGGSMLLSSYIATAAFTGVQGVRDANGDQPTYIPVAGPWMHLANSSESVLDQVLLAGSGIAQGAGLVISVLSFIVPERVPAATVQAGGVSVGVTVGSGVHAVGRF